MSQRDTSAPKPTVIALCHPKGGTGKTTLAINLAAHYARQGLPVHIFDTNVTQQSALDWSRKREAHADAVAEVTVSAVSGTEVAQHIRMTRAEIVIVDTPGRLEPRALATVITQADVVLMPLRPGPFEFWTSDDIAEMITARQVLTGRPAAAWVISQAKASSTLGADIRAAMEDTGIPVMDAGTTDRVAYQRSTLKGLSAAEYEPGGKAAAEIAAIAAATAELAGLVAGA